jgi:hypothetical protein
VHISVHPDPTSKPSRNRDGGGGGGGGGARGKK